MLNSNYVVIVKQEIEKLLVVKLNQLVEEATWLLMNACYGTHKKLSQFDSFQYLFEFHAS